LSNPKQRFAWKFEGNDLLIHAPSVIFDPINTVVVVETKGKLEVASNMPSLKDGTILLPADFADIHNPGYGTHAFLIGSGKKSVIQNWVDGRARLEWMFNANESGKYKLEALMKVKEACKLNVFLGDNNIESEIQSTNDKFEIISLGEIDVTEVGSQTISLKPVLKDWAEVELIYLELVK
jgi:alpha-L-fucosidase